MASEKLTLTQEDYEKNERELAELKAKLEQVNEQLREARNFGDLSENAEYDAAREEQERTQARINEISTILHTAEVVDIAELMKDGLRVMIGTIVEVADDKGKSMTLRLVSTTTTDSLAGAISSESPVGEALLGHGEGETVEYMTPSGKVRSLTIRSISLPSTKVDNKDE